MAASNNWDTSARLGGLRRFAIAITVLNILGHTFLGFEQSLAQPLVALATAYPLAIVLEFAQARAAGRKPAFAGGVKNVIDFLLSAHISALAVAMLIYANDRLWVVSFATAVAIGSKVIFRVASGRGARHFYNPSNFGITVTLLLFTWVGIAPPYHFTENLDRIGDWVLPAIIICTGTFLNARFTHRLPLILAWLIGIAMQAGVRSLVFDTPLEAALLPMTSVAFILYTFYMITDPGTTPGGVLSQLCFGLSVAVVYGLLMVFHVVFGLFFALSIVSTVRGIVLYLHSWQTSRILRDDSLVVTTQMKEVS
jgi:Na+-translocating ferredoxin:NAD+ oxidoreductase RnfD subunit